MTINLSLTTQGHLGVGQTRGTAGWARRGLRAGAVTGLALSIVLVPVNFYLHNSFAGEISVALGTHYEYTMIFALQSASQTFAIVALAGLAYGAFYARLPGHQPFPKALSIGTFLYLVTLTVTYSIDFQVSQRLFYSLNLLNIPVYLLAFPLLLSKAY